ncbi:hypothetical protein ACHAW6_014328 [Cyclotella cf. meneghiniana]
MACSSSDSESNSDVNDEEAALLFPPNNNFNSATFGPVAGENVKGVASGIRYEKSRWKRNENARKKHLEAAHAFDIDDRNEYTSSSSFRCISNVLILIFVCAVAMSILDRRQRRRIKLVLEMNSRRYHGSAPSSRWGHRFDDDDDSMIKGKRDELTIAYQSGYKGTAHIAKYRSHNNNPHAASKLTPQDMELAIEEWEEYGMEVEHLLSSAGSDWDIYSNPEKASEYAENTHFDENASVGDEYNDHWVQYFDTSSKQTYYYHVETNTTQWDKPRIVEGVALYGYDFDTGEEVVLEGEEGAETADPNQDST